MRAHRLEVRGPGALSVPVATALLREHWISNAQADTGENAKRHGREARFPHRSHRREYEVCAS